MENRLGVIEEEEWIGSLGWIGSYTVGPCLSTLYIIDWVC